MKRHLDGLNELSSSVKLLRAVDGRDELVVGKRHWSLWI